MKEREVKLEESWRSELQTEFSAAYMQNLRSFLVSEYQRGKRIFPRGDEYFAALDLTPFDDVKVVILGQDPYHGDGQAHGLCFSVKPGVPLPPSLVNIYKEMKDDLDINQPRHGYLIDWARQGVLLLNSVLTVERSRAGSHQNKGWERFTDRIIELLNSRKEPMVFMLWGAYAQRKGQFIDQSRHLVLSSPHPSPLSASRGFFGSRHFSKANEFLRAKGLTEIDWQLQELGADDGKN